MIKLKFNTFLILLSKRFHLCFAIATLAFAIQGLSLTLSSIPLERGFAKMNVVSELDLSTYSIPKGQQKKAVEIFCSRMREEFKRYSWDEAPCAGVEWFAELNTQNRFPLLYTSFGEGPNTTLILGGVHPDELTPIHLAFRFARYLQSNPSVYKEKGIRVVIAPIINPDGFLRPRPTRTNASEVDLNRNFLTMDWYQDALQTWTTRKNSRQRFFPGYFPNSEIETVFQNKLLDQFLPSKVLSIHAPLGFYDYDGPGDKEVEPVNDFEKNARYLVRSVSEKSRNYKIVDYSFYPGSLGNLAGKQKRVPTLTLELETTNPKRVDEYWEKFLPGFLHSVEFAYK